MAPLTSNMIQQLAANILEDLAGTEFACSSLSRIPGGSASFTFRGILRSPLVFSEEGVVSSVIVKKATDFAAINREFALDSSRSRHEDIMLKALACLGPSSETATVPVRTPQTFAYIGSSHIQIIEDLQPAKNLASVLTSSADGSSQPDFIAVGRSLGSWLRAFHTWAKAPRQDVLKRMMRENQSSRNLKWRTTYDTIVDIASDFPVIPKEHVDILSEVREQMKGPSPDYRPDPDFSHQERDWYGLIHADFWAGNVLFAALPEPQLYIIDFEFAHLGHRATDLGQMIGDLLEKSYMSDSDDSTQSNCETVLKAFVGGYGVIDEDMARRVAIHAGVHMINWCARHPGAELRGKVEGLMQRAVTIIVKAWEERPAFEGDILGCLFCGAD